VSKFVILAVAPVVSALAIDVVRDAELFIHFFLEVL
jgi:hypothetical protein